MRRKAASFLDSLMDAERPRFECLDCPAVFSQRTSLTRHMSKCTMTNRAVELLPSAWFSQFHPWVVFLLI
jgi:hypothetical protein